MIDTNTDIGLFAQLLIILGYLGIAETHDAIPHRSIKYTNKISNDIVVLYDNNIWNDYFKSFNTLTDEEVKKYRIIPKNFTQSLELAALYIYPPWQNPNLSLFKKVVKKYTILNDETKAKIDDEYNRLFPKNQKILGVHARGTDLFASRVINPNDQQVTDSFFASDIENIQKIFNKHNYDKIFLSTDDITYRDLFKSKFGDKCFFTDVIRFSVNITDNEYNLSYNSGETYESKTYQRQSPQLTDFWTKFRVFKRIHTPNTKKAGFDGILDAVLLARCDGIVCGLSDFSAFSVFFSDSLKDHWYLSNIRKGL